MRQLINQYHVTLVSPKPLDDKWHKLCLLLNSVQGRAQGERLYLATLNPMLDVGVLREYRKRAEQDYLITVGFVFLIVALVLAILFVGVMRYKKTKKSRR